MYSMTNSIPIFVKPLKIRILPIPRMPKIKKTLISHSYTQKLLDTSFSPSLPFRPLRDRNPKTRETSPAYSGYKGLDSSYEENTSVLPAINITHKRVLSVSTTLPSVYMSNDIIEKPNIETDFSRYIVRYTNFNQTSVISSSQPISGINDELKSLAVLINSFLLKKSNCLEELLVDFVKDPKENFIFIACKRFKIKGEQPHEMSPIKKEASRNTNHMPFPDIVISVAEKQSPFGEEKYETDLKKSRVSGFKEEMKIDKAQNLLEQQVSDMEIKKDIIVSIKDIRDVNKESYLQQKRSDKHGRIPYNIIGIMPHAKNNQLISFIEKQKEPTLKPLRHKERSKNLF